MKIKFTKDDKLEASLQLERMLLSFDEELISYKVDQRIKEIDKALCDRCIYKLFDVEKHKLVNQKLFNNFDFNDITYLCNDKLYHKLRVDISKQCSFCTSKLFETEKAVIERENFIFLLEKNEEEREAISKKKSNIKILRYFYIYICICIFSLIIEIYKKL